MQPGRHTDDMEVPEGEPTPAEIKAMCEEIRKEWTGIKHRDARRQEMVPWQVQVWQCPKGLDR